MKESVFSSIHNDDKQEYLKLVDKFKGTDSKLIFDDDDVLIFALNSLEDVQLFYTGHHTSDHWDDVQTIKQYVVIELENSKDPFRVAAFPDGSLKFSKNEHADFGYKHKLKPYTKKEIQSHPIEDLVSSISDDIIDIDYFDFELQQQLIANKAKLIKKLNPELLTDDEFIGLVDSNSDAPKHLPKKYLLRYKKAKLNPEEVEILNQQDLYVFLARDKFVELPNGTYKKDIEIENLLKIDQYSQEGQLSMHMLQIRARHQDDVKVYILWSNAGLIEDVLDDQPWKINDEKYTYLRNSIATKMIPYGQAHREPMR